jgi:hypothetical protein
MEQNQVTLVDTSSWIEALRLNGRENIREQVKLLLIDGLAAWCDMVAVELWNPFCVSFSAISTDLR